MDAVIDLKRDYAWCDADLVVAGIAALHKGAPSDADSSTNMTDPRMVVIVMTWSVDGVAYRRELRIPTECLWSTMGVSNTDRMGDKE